MNNFIEIENFSIEDLGEIEMDVYDIEVADNHNFFGNNILVHNSNYVCLDEIIKKIGITFKNNDEYREFVNKLDVQFFKPFFDKILNIYAKKYNVEQIINFKREKTITQKFILAKKKYADEVVENEGEVYEKPKIFITGIEIVRTDTPSFCRKYIQGVVEKIFEVKGKDKDLVIDELRTIHSKFLKQEPTNIAFPTGIKEYTKYANETEHYIKEGLSYPKHCPMHVRAAMNYNYLIKKYNLSLEPVYNGSKMKYIYIFPNNILHQNIIGFVGNWPEKYNDFFKVDYELQWEKSFTSVIQRFFTVLNWDEINLNQNALEDIIEF